MQLFYAPSLLPSEEFFTLDKDESHHVVKVLRMVEGETLLATNGRGVMVRGRIALASPSGSRYAWSRPWRTTSGVPTAFTLP